MNRMNSLRNPRVLGLVARSRRTVISQSRWNSTQPPPSDPKQISPHIGFYKTFARPIAKVLLMATFTYQLAYWGWVKLEKDEIKAERRVEIEALEGRLKELTNGRDGKPTSS